MADEKKSPGQAEEIDLTPTDEQILDEVWDALNNKWREEDKTSEDGKEARNRYERR